MHHKKNMGCHQLTYKKSDFTLGVLYGKQVSGKEKRRDSYTFGFNGMEKVNEQYGEGNAYDFGARMYDPRIGKWFGPDPLAMKNTANSPYAFANNSPISIVDKEGQDDIYYLKIIASDGHTYFKTVTYNSNDPYIKNCDCSSTNLFVRESQIDKYPNEDFNTKGRSYDRVYEVTIDLREGIDKATFTIDRDEFVSRPSWRDTFYGIKIWGDGGDPGNSRRGKTYPIKEGERPSLDISSDEWKALNFAIGSIKGSKYTDVGPSSQDKKAVPKAIESDKNEHEKVEEGSALIEITGTVKYGNVTSTTKDYKNVPVSDTDKYENSRVIETYPK